MPRAMNTMPVCTKCFRTDTGQILLSQVCDLAGIALVYRADAFTIPKETDFSRYTNYKLDVHLAPRKFTQVEIRYKVFKSGAGEKSSVQSVRHEHLGIALSCFCIQPICLWLLISLLMRDSCCCELASTAIGG